VPAEGEVRAVTGGPLDEELDCVRRCYVLRRVDVGSGQGRNREQHLTGDAERLPAGREDPDGRRRAKDSITDRSDRSADVLAVVQDQEPFSRCHVAYHSFRQVAVGAAPDPEGAHQCLDHVVLALDSGELRVPRLFPTQVTEGLGVVHCQAGLTRPTRADEGDQIVARHERREPRELVLATDEGRHSLGKGLRPPSHRR
jgi:hypothetical protein